MDNNTIILFQIGERPHTGETITCGINILANVTGVKLYTAISNYCIKKRVSIS